MEFKAKKISHILEMVKIAMRSSWTYKLGENIITIAKEKKDLGVVIQDNLSPDKHINRILGDTFRMLRNIRMAFIFLNKDMMRKIITTMIRLTFYRYFQADCSSELANCMPLPLQWPCCTRLSMFSHPYSVHLPNARVNQYLHSFIPYTGKLSNFRTFFLCLFFHLPIT